MTSIVDAHTHVVARDEARYPLRPSGVGTAWFRDTPCTIEDLATTMDTAAVDAAVLVQAFGAYSYDNSYVVDAASARGGRFVSVAVVDAEDPASPARVRELARREGFTGVRLFSIGARGRLQPTWLDDPSTFPLWEACAELDLRVVVACLPEHLERLTRVLDCFADQPVVLDHCGFVDVTTVDGAAPLYRLAARANLHCKVTSHVLETVERGADPATVIGRLAAEFGAGRLVWGSDFPQTHDRPYTGLVALAQRACGSLAERDRALVLGGNARRLFGLASA